MKDCSVCGKEKAASEFQTRHLSHDGLTAACKECLHARDKARYPGEREMRAAQAKRYYKTPRGKQIVDRSKKKWQQNHLIKRAAHILVGNAVRDGLLQKKPCEVCGSTRRIHGHHEDYAKPLEVQWLCPKHHTDRHRVIDSE